MFNGFEPVFDQNSRVLILGSFPSVKSRENGFYYGNKQNRFWRTLEQVFGEKIGDEKSSKIDFLLRHKIALYDVVSKSDLVGSADQVLEQSNYIVADFGALFPPNTKVEKILCNGKTAYNLFINRCTTKIPVVCMPSTSSANVRFDQSKWQEELNLLL